MLYNEMLHFVQHDSDASMLYNEMLHFVQHDSDASMLYDEMLHFVQHDSARQCQIQKFAVILTVAKKLAAIRR